MKDGERHKENIVLVRRWRSAGYFEGSKLTGELACSKMSVRFAVDDIASVEMQSRAPCIGYSSWANTAERNWRSAAHLEFSECRSRDVSKGMEPRTAFRVTDAQRFYGGKHDCRGICES